LRKISRCQILRLKCTKIDFDWGSAPDPAAGAYSAPPDLLAGFKGAYTSKVREGTEGRKRREMGREVKGEGREVKGEGREEKGEGGEGTSPSRIGKVKRWQGPIVGRQGLTPDISQRYGMACRR